MTGMRTLSMRVSQISGPPLGGLAMGLGGAPAAFAVAGVLFAGSLPLLLTVRLRPLDVPDTSEVADAADVRGEGADVRSEAPAPASAWQDLLGGLRHLRRHRLIGPLIAVIAISELGLTGTLNVGMVLLSGERGWGPSGYGWIISGFGTGATVGAVLLTVAGRLPRAGLPLAGTLSVGCAGAAAIALLPTLPPAVALAGAVGLAMGICGTLANALVQTAADPAYLGRVTSLVMLTSVGLAPMSYPLVGAAIGVWGAAPVFVGCGVFGSVGVVVALACRTVRRAELPGSRRRPSKA